MLVALVITINIQLICIDAQSEYQVLRKCIQISNVSNLCRYTKSLPQPHLLYPLESFSYACSKASINQNTARQAAKTKKKAESLIRLQPYLAFMFSMFEHVLNAACIFNTKINNRCFDRKKVKANKKILIGQENNPMGQNRNK